jgi:apolipoprotein N-acyltransferase
VSDDSRKDDANPNDSATGKAVSVPEPEERQRVAAIISRGKRTRPGSLITLLLAFLSTVLLWCAFTPLDWGPLAWVALVPLLQLVRPLQPTRLLYLIVFLVGTCFWLVSLQWMRLGDPSMFLALLALSLYLACYWPLFLWLARAAVHQLRLPLLLAAPVLWTGLEFVRAHLFTGFAWYLLGHTQYRWVEMIQISDLVGAYGVSFAVVLANVALAQLVPRGWLVRWQLCWPAEDHVLKAWGQRARWLGVGVSVVVVLCCWGYGTLRRGHAAFPLGPRVALIQGNFTATVRNDLYDPREIFMTHRQLTGLTVADRPDVVIWPEGMFPYGMHAVEQGVSDEQLQTLAPEIPPSVWRGNEAQQALSDLSEMTNAALIIGLSMFVAQPASFSIYNSAVFIQPGAGVVDRYDKIHRVPFGEYIPLREAFPMLQSLTPFRGKFGIDRGSEAHVFRFRDWQLIPLICFEDTVPHLVRRIAREAKVNGGQQQQCLVNLTNDGWFHGSSELDQHLITSLFRAVETRTPLVRAVNTGISAIIDGDGVIREPDRFLDLDAQLTGSSPRTSLRDPRTGEFHRQLNCALIADVPLDPRKSLYVSMGDLFAAVCLAGCLAVAIPELLVRRRFSKATR